ncbi:unnamed protein product [Kuraishia capsulata CBS 1993]|uniref:Swiss Army Knife RNA repair protein HAD domain-containing protein n=1 Tax=Kuraishia capsulata CBS 1993 TaxID=1382522 RepID=W6MKU8_9ASCO|nr:uncharacterized protein KUCA_T00003081001 [Kuraishia capsulata CBS 1993]CDK27104.1 unnamed protein product [Kuraishia capsulata CBS 1993]
MITRRLHIYNLEGCLLKEPTFNPDIWYKDCTKNIESLWGNSPVLLNWIFSEQDPEFYLNNDLVRLIRLDEMDEETRTVVISDKPYLECIGPIKSMLDSVEIKCDLVLTSSSLGNSMQRKWEYTKKVIQTNLQYLEEVLFYGPYEEETEMFISSFHQLGVELGFQTHYIETPKLAIYLHPDSELDVVSQILAQTSATFGKKGPTLKNLIGGSISYELSTESQKILIEYFRKTLNLSSDWIFDCKAIPITSPFKAVPKAILEQLGLNEHVTMVPASYGISPNDDTIMVKMISNREFTQCFYGDLGLRIAYKKDTPDLQSNLSRIKSWNLVDDYFEVQTVVKHRKLYRIVGKIPQTRENIPIPGEVTEGIDSEKIRLSEKGI